jgi:hypothetical protein
LYVLVSRYPILWLLLLFSATLCYGQPTPLSPGKSSEPGGRVTSYRPTFKWQGVSGATKYGLYISKYPYGAANIVYEKEDISGSQTSFTLDRNLEPGHLYRWNMRAYKNGQWTPYSDRLYFYIPPPPPEPLSPGTSSSPGPVITTLTPTFTWKPSQNVSYYAFYVLDVTTNQLVFDSEEEGLKIRATSYTLPSGKLNWSRKYRWNMRAFTEEGGYQLESDFSHLLYPLLYFQTASFPRVETRAATNISPTSAVINAYIVDDGGAPILERRFDWGTDPNNLNQWTNQVTVSDNSFSYQLTGLLSGKTYYFRAWARNVAGWAHGNTLSFTTPSKEDKEPPTISNVRSNPLSLPSSGGTITIRADVTDNVAVSAVQMKVMKPGGAIETVDMSRESGNTFKVSYSVPANTTNSPQRYFFKIRAVDTSNNPAESPSEAQVWYYWDVEAPSPNNQPPSKPSNPSPADGATNQPTSLTLSWSSSGATRYDLYFGTDSNPPLKASDLTSNQYSVSNLSPGTIYYWKVVAKNDYGQTAGDVWWFTTATQVTGRFKIGDRVCVTYTAGSLTVRDNPAGNAIAYKKPGQEGKIVDGPRSTSDGLTWWKIEWSDGVVGWSHESGSKGIYLEVLPGKGNYSSGVSHNGLSYRVRVYDDTSSAGGLNVRKGPGLSYEAIKRQPVGARGWTSDEAPYTFPSPYKADGMIWWLIKWDDGTIGWSADSRLNEGVFLVKEQEQPFSRVAVLSVSPGSTLDFGTVKPGEYKDYSIAIQNDSASTGLLTGSISVSGTGFKLLGSSSFQRLPGERRIITVRFQPPSSGDYSGTLSITHNATDYNSPITYSLEGKGSSDAKSVNINYPLSLNFGSIKLK